VAQQRGGTMFAGRQILKKEEGIKFTAGEKDRD
jgi:hypothetical protein